MESKTFAWIGAGTDMQAQKDELLGFAEKTCMRIDKFIHAQSLYERPPDKDKYIRLTSGMNSGDTLIVSNLAMLGRSIHEVLRITKLILDMGVHILAVKQDLDLDPSHEGVSRARIDMLGILWDVQQEIVSQRTRQGLAARKMAGMNLGRPKGSIGKSKLDPHKKEIAAMLKHRAPLSYIARVYGVTWPTVENFIRTRKLEKPTFCS
ncbi:MAG TPA: hypothetical protein ENN05_00640 [Deltaproteobacteria bacterium]|nr:hypothetical protein [Deltaproteobacteria bacterium]